MGREKQDPVEALLDKWDRLTLPQMKEAIRYMQRDFDRQKRKAEAEIQNSDQ